MDDAIANAGGTKISSTTVNGTSNGYARLNKSLNVLGYILCYSGYNVPLSGLNINLFSNSEGVQIGPGIYQEDTVLIYYYT